MTLKQFWSKTTGNNASINSSCALTHIIIKHDSKGEWGFKLFYRNSCLQEMKHVLRNSKLAMSLKGCWQPLQTDDIQHSTAKNTAEIVVT